MAVPPSSEAASFPVPTQFVYEGRADRFRAAVDVAPATIDDVTVEVGPRRLRIAVDRPDGVAERTVTPLPPDLVFGDERTAVYNNGVLSVSLETHRR
ncbi:Hsp20/alpha crystallin family protein [Natrinema longum]|uniref:Hsp20/alpha crystallin family protein n=1 Tax=Natrinema longum TaxID=370324 RepID=A0A8A2UDH4_9EURY|nr:Hsp20/alpha crystallin family protein [Natrinema longum]MBZ6495791.1 Hsp20/alpha crystallin family protein [Natrinema longum]QSW86265.1 Hsp20/alpha crystallin family protein [Natrinema longum]